MQMNNLNMNMTTLTPDYGRCAGQSPSMLLLGSLTNDTI